MIKIAVIGASGRMGREIMQIIRDDSDTLLVGAAERADSELIGALVHNVKITGDIAIAAKDADVIIDFTGSAGTRTNLPIYAKLKKAVVLGSTGLTEQDIAQIEALSKDMPVLWASNMSVGVNVLAKLVEMAAKALGDQFDIEVFEAHHKHKIDAPSGTAITLAEAAAKGRSLNLSTSAVYSREGMTGARKQDEIGFQVLRGGDIAGDHTVFFCAEGERIELTHRATNRQILAKGAVRAAKWMADRPAGFYSISDVLGF
jgi:4-hydroxy-tetrahydrodipicolinate reductase